MALDTRVKEKRDEILRIAAEHGARNVRVFGSVARGDFGPDSDVDFLVEMEPGRSLMDMGGLLMDLQDLLSCKVHLVTERMSIGIFATKCRQRRCRCEGREVISYPHQRVHSARICRN